MTQVTSPDNIPSPDLTDQYALTQDMANLADGTQKALIKRANFYVGTSAQRTAFTTAPEGTHWQDTNGSKWEYVRKSGLWVALVDDTGWVPVTLASGVTGSLKISKVNDVVYLKGDVVLTVAGGAQVQIATGIPAQFRPLEYEAALSAIGYAGSSSNTGAAASVNLAGNIWARNTDSASRNGFRLTGTWRR